MVTIAFYLEKLHVCGKIGTFGRLKIGVNKKLAIPKDL